VTAAGRVVVVTGTSTDVGKTVATAALAAAARAAGARVSVCKPAQTGVRPGQPGDLDEIVRLAGLLPTREVVRYLEPLAPETAARRSAAPYLQLSQVVDAVGKLRAQSDLVLVEGAGGVLVRLAPELTIREIAVALDAEVVVVADPGLGSLNHTELTVDALGAVGCRPAGLVLGRWPAHPDLATTCNRVDLPRLTGLPLLGAVPDGAARLDPADFQAAAPDWWRPGAVDRVLAGPVRIAAPAPAPAPREPRYSGVK